eukprot:TRINITY_DN3852_c0_g2_i2.p1 TRINITY_DN3852_c0_g2~~TRINITY_DN3852_c0_g2_i2.p1  ORF type:complete len:748 (+),score=98.13 TRINITY_DN3852_c0_g2_i2:57-2300(+)
MKSESVKRYFRTVQPTRGQKFCYVMICLIIFLAIYDIYLGLSSHDSPCYGDYGCCSNGKPVPPGEPCPSKPGHLCNVYQECRECIPELNNRCCDSDYSWVLPGQRCLFERADMICSEQHACVQRRVLHLCNGDADCCLDGSPVPPGEPCVTRPDYLCNENQLCKECHPILNSRCCTEKHEWVKPSQPCLYENNAICTENHDCVIENPVEVERDVGQPCDSEGECCGDGQFIVEGQDCRYTADYICDHRHLCRVCDPLLNSECCSDELAWVEPMRPCLESANKYCGTDHLCYDNPVKPECNSEEPCCYEGRWIPEGELCKNQNVLEKCDSNHHCVARIHTRHPYHDREPVVDLMDYNLEPKRLQDIQPHLERLTYMDPKANKKILPPLDRYFLYTIHESGFNNRRMSLESAFIFAYVTNRTFVLLENEILVPYLIAGLETKFWDIIGMKTGWPTLSYKEFRSLPNYDEIMSDVLHVPWKDLSNGDSVIYIPKIIEEGDQDWQTYLSWRYPRGPFPPPEYGQKYDFDSLPRFREARVLKLDDPAFTHFHTLFYPRFFAMGVTFKSIKRMIRDHLHLRKEIFHIASLVLSYLPPVFQAMHMRRGDLAYETGKIPPHVIFGNLKKLYTPKVPLYIATDHPHDRFQTEILPSFNHTYPVITFHDVKDTIPFMDPKWIPLVEKLICSVATVFAGTHYSTFTSYIHRLRGYSRLPIDKNVYFTHLKYGAPNTQQEVTYFSWDREYPRSWENIEW